MTDKVLCLYDIHIPDQSDDAVLLALDYASKSGCNRVVLGGDTLDFHHLSSFLKDPTRPSLLEELDGVKPLLKLLVENFGPTTFLVGNHELRLQHYIWSNAVKLSGLPGLELKNMLGLDELWIDYVDNIVEMSSGRQPFSIGNLVYLHGHELRFGYGVINPAKCALERCHHNVIMGHVHRVSSHTIRSIMGDVRGGWSCGTLGPLSASYQPVSNWSHGFAIVSYDVDGNFEVQNKMIVNGRVV